MTLALVLKALAMQALDLISHPQEPCETVHGSMCIYCQLPPTAGFETDTGETTKACTTISLTATEPTQKTLKGSGMQCPIPQVVLFIYLDYHTAHTRHILQPGQLLHTCNLSFWIPGQPALSSEWVLRQPGLHHILTLPHPLKKRVKKTKTIKKNNQEGNQTHHIFPYKDNALVTFLPFIWWWCGPTVIFIWLGW